MESFDHVHLFHILKEQDEIKARGVINVLKVHSRDFKGEPCIDIHGIKVLHPADYNNMWIEVPKKTKEILAGYKNQNMQVYFNVSSGSAAMTSTWLFMKGTEDVDAEIISPQIDKAKNRKPYLHNIDLGTYPHVNKIKDKIQKTLGIPQEFKSDEM